jgi:DNA-binding transcriptional regulator LsrR (DeoR family)
MTRTDRVTKALELRSQGQTTRAIALALGISRQGVEKILRRIDRRELVRLATRLDALKVTQHHQLETIIEESFHAWEKSCQPLKRARKTTGDDGGDTSEVMSTDVIERCGDVSYLETVMQAMDAQARLWGLEVLPAAHERPSSLSQLMADLKARAEEYETRERAADPDPTPT